ncbi:MAG: hypothetical protein WKF37_08975 [Bryobacteraceae bacterium]
MSTDCVHSIRNIRGNDLPAFGLKEDLRCETLKGIAGTGFTGYCFTPKSLADQRVPGLTVSDPLVAVTANWMSSS